MYFTVISFYNDNDNNINNNQYSNYKAPNWLDRGYRTVL